MADGWPTSPNSSGQTEIYVQPFPNVGGGHWQVSTAGGSQPLWSKNTKELFYVGANRTLMGVPVQAIGATWNNGTPTQLLEARYVTAAGSSGGRTYDVSPDGQRFLMIKATRERRGCAAASTHRRTALGRGAEAPRADEVRAGHPGEPPPPFNRQQLPFWRDP